MDQLLDRGYAQVDADMAWRTAAGGGANLLRNLRYSEIDEEIDRLDAVINSSNTEKNGD